MVEALRKRPEAWVDFMMRFELGLERPDPARALWSALTIGGAYAVGGFIPLPPDMLIPRPLTALAVSSGSRSPRSWSSATSRAASPACARCAARCRPS